MAHHARTGSATPYLAVVATHVRQRLGVALRPDRLGRFVAVWLMAMLVGAGEAAADARYAALAVDANTGEVLHAEGADEARYPASLTKMMTLYLVFEQLRDRKLRPDSRISVSEEAASMPPSRLGLEPGATISVSDAIRALVTKSANDVAVAVAEQIAGSEERFAALMTRRARELGMRSTTFRNAHGLPDAGQLTTARDMIRLALRLYDDFPAESRVFASRTFVHAGRTHRNHNTLLGTFAGMEGIKTGYTRASGFNLVASVRRDGRHVVAAVFGGQSASVRNARMRVILARALSRASPVRTRVRAVPVPVPVARARPPAVAVAPIPRPTPEPRLVAPVEPAVPTRRIAEASAPEGDWRTTPRFAANVAGGASVASHLGYGTSPLAAGGGRAPSTLEAQAARLRGTTTDHPAPTARQPISDHRVAAAAGRGGVEIQIGAYADENEARSRLRAALALSPGALAGAMPVTPTVRVGGRTLYRARFSGLDPASAASACTALRRHQVDCLVTRSE